MQKRSYRIPQNKRNRLLLGWGLVFGGLVGFLPVVGFWMLPLGISILAIDLPWALRIKRRCIVRWGRRNGKPARPSQSGS